MCRAGMHDASSDRGRACGRRARWGVAAGGRSAGVTGCSSRSSRRAPSTPSPGRPPPAPPISSRSPGPPTGPASPTSPSATTSRSRAGSPTAMSTVWYDPVATLAFLAAATERVRLLSHVAVVGLRHPLLSAKQYATLDHLSGGRLILGVGAGHVQEEFEALGVDFARARGRARRDDRRAAGGARAGGVPRVPRASGSPSRASASAPARPGAAIPVWVGGSSPAAVRRAALSGDGWLPQGDPRDRLPAQIARLRAAARGGGRRRRPSRSAPSPSRCTSASPAWDVGRRTLTGKPERARRVAAGVRGDGRGPDPGAVPQPEPRRTDRPDGGVRRPMSPRTSTP